MLGPLVTVLITVGAVSLMMLIERAKPLHRYPKDPYWFMRLVLLGGLGVALTEFTGIYLPPLFKGAFSFTGSWGYLANVPAWINGLLGYFCISFFIYWWHRLRHHNNLMWKIFHQIHHSTYRLEALTALYGHPCDFIANTLIVNIVCYCLLGFDINSAAWAALWVGIFEFWEHTNIQTPHWLGYFIVRPEMHRIHHERGRHQNNYGLPVWDMLFSTYENSSRKVVCGFELESEKRLAAMLACEVVE
jgi:sterol desaturase/sphingolipid hydroxylase (fatty acid hydroxylase superfamily)